MNRAICALPGLCLCVLWCSGCGSSNTAQRVSVAESSRKDVAAVTNVLREIIAADNAMDVDRIASLYEEDAVNLPPNGPAVQGRVAIKERYRSGFAQAKLELSFISEETHVGGEWAFDRGITKGRNVWRNGDPPTEFEHKYVMLLRRQADGSWKIARLIWNSNVPEPAK